jgi:hypothetical protein
VTQSLFTSLFTKNWKDKRKIHLKNLRPNRIEWYFRSRKLLSKSSEYIYNIKYFLSNSDQDAFLWIFYVFFFLFPSKLQWSITSSNSKLLQDIKIKIETISASIIYKIKIHFFSSIILHLSFLYHRICIYNWQRPTIGIKGWNNLKHQTRTQHSLNRDPTYWSLSCVFFFILPLFG